jgi:hypothetical protein
MSGRRFAHLAKLLGLSSDPPAPETGDVWWRTDRAQIHAADSKGSITVGPTGNLPVIRSGAWHTLPGSGAPSSVSVPADRLYALPLYPGRQSTLQGVTANVTVELIGSVMRMGLYASDGTVPTTLVADFGTVTSDITGPRSITGLSASVRPVLHFLVIARQGGSLTLSLSARDTRDPLIADSSASLTDNRTAYYRDTVPGALPASFGAVAGTAQGPSVAVQVG